MSLPHRSPGYTVTSAADWNPLIDVANVLFGGTAGQSLVAAGGGALAGWGSGQAAAYAATLANVLNTTTETDVLHFTIPANTMSDGDVIDVKFTALAKNNKGSVGVATFKVNVGAGSQVTTASPQAADSATEYTLMLGFTIQRMGSTVAIVDLNGVSLSNPWSNAAAAGTSTPTNFTGANVVTLKVTLDAADASFYLKPQSAKITHFKN